MPEFHALPIGLVKSVHISLGPTLYDLRGFSAENYIHFFIFQDLIYICERFRWINIPV
jgi:hypothetical protein